jgi:hypothetical protein|tara:strand:+ start:383 stop:529 length:147 start_codon:yes stop_codon:yes gene_type:complete
MVTVAVVPEDPEAAAQTQELAAAEDTTVQVTQEDPVLFLYHIQDLKLD